MCCSSVGRIEVPWTGWLYQQRSSHLPALQLALLLLLTPVLTKLETDVGVCVGDDGTCTAASASSNSTRQSQEPVCADTDASCRSWARRGECKKNPQYMLVSCQKSCGVCNASAEELAALMKVVKTTDENDCVTSDDCQDCNSNCKTWADEGECQRNPSYMKATCGPSCGLCQVGDPHPSERPDCQDTHRHCHGMAMKGGCHTNHSMMMRDCKRSCRVCGDDDPCMPNASDAGVVPKRGDLNNLMEHIIKTENVTILNSDPYVLLLHNVVSDELLDGVVGLFSEKWERSRVGGVVGSDGVQEIRTSEQQWCREECEKLPQMTELTERVEGIVGALRRNFEDPQILRYKAGQYYKQHNDFVSDQVRMPIGPRVLTLFLYLNDVEDGGTTDFPALNLSVPPRKGTALLWPSVLNSHPFREDPRLTHEGKPPLGDSVKLAVNFWVHQYDFRKYNRKACLWSRRPRGSYIADEPS